MRWHDRFSTLPELVDDYIGMVKGLMERHYDAVTRYAASTFPCMKFGEALRKHAIAPRIYGRADDAKGGLRGGGWAGRREAPAAGPGGADERTLRRGGAVACGAAPPSFNSPP